ncbi:MAG: hypothetical protein KDN19_02755 [Verrucomicrobiae bacterium]|nr:hypothetical protein [Verrucomicrobiae bacterium]
MWSMMTVAVFACGLEAQETSNSSPKAAENEEPKKPTPSEVPENQGKISLEKKASVGASIGENGMGRIVVEAHGELPEPPLFFVTRVDSKSRAGAERVTTEAHFVVEIRQGKAGTLRFELRGEDEVVSVKGSTVKAWSLRREGEKKRFLDVTVNEAQKHEFDVALRSDRTESLPATHQLAHFAPLSEASAGFDEFVELSPEGGMSLRVTKVADFLPVTLPGTKADRFQTSTGGSVEFVADRSLATPEVVELSDVALSGRVNPETETVEFQLSGTAVVSEADASLAILGGRAAVSRVPASRDYRVELSRAGGTPEFRLVFPRAGTFPVAIEFVASIQEGAWRQLSFTVAGGAVVPMTLEGLGKDLEFSRGADVVTPTRRANEWVGFLPASGRANLAWKPDRRAGEGKLFFTTAAHVETRLGAGLLRQDHEIEFRVLQGRLDSLGMTIEGEGEVLAVEGPDVTGWQIEAPANQGEKRRLVVALSRPVTESLVLKVRTQTPLDAFPVRMKAMRLTPMAAVRHSGYLRLSNLGSVRLEPADTSGLTQLAPDQYPGEALEARQVFAYRFPSADYDLEVAADRVQPEVSVSQVVRYEVTETDRIISADIELDIREAAIREWPIEIPEDYSVVSVVGSAVGDYVAASENVDGRRNLNVIFSQEVAGRQLIQVLLEKNEAAVAGEWSLPRLEYPEAKSSRGDIGVVGAPGFRIGVAATDLLVEKPLSYFPKPVPRLQQAFRIREPEWTATMTIEPLEKSIQADLFHLYSLVEGTAYASAVVNYFVTGAPVSEWELKVPETLENVTVDGQDVRTWRRDGDTLKVSLHQPVIGPYTLLVTFEEAIGNEGGRLTAGEVTPLGVQSERGYVELVSPKQVRVDPVTVSEGLLPLDPLELPAEFRLLSGAPSLGVWQYTERPFALDFDVGWFEPGTTVDQVVEFADIGTEVSADGEVVTDLVYYVKSRGRSALSIKLPEAVRLWAVTVAGRSVNARQDGDTTLIPLPGAVDPNLPVEARLRLGRPAVDGRGPRLELPVVDAPVLKTEWRVHGDETRVLVPSGGNVEPPEPVLPATGFSRVARHGLGWLLVVGALAAIGVGLGRTRTKLFRTTALLALAGAVIVALFAAAGLGAIHDPVSPLRLSLPILSAGEAIVLDLESLPAWRSAWSWFGILLGIGGLGSVGFALLRLRGENRTRLLVIGLIAFFLGLLWQRHSDPWFFVVVAAILLAGLLVPAVRNWRREFPRKKKEKAKSENGGETASGSVAKPSALIAFAALMLGATADSGAAEKNDSVFSNAESIRQEWTISQETGRLRASGVAEFSGKAGDSFLLLKDPAILTRFEGEGVRVSKRSISGDGKRVAYVVSLTDAAATGGGAETSVRRLTFEYELAVPDPVAGIDLPTGPAIIEELSATYDRGGWEFVSPQALRIEPLANAGEKASGATLLLEPGGGAKISLKPRSRDVTAEETRFYVEAEQLYLPGPGVLDGRHRFRVRPSQGQVSALTMRVPAGLTVSEVTGPVGTWQFDADSGALSLNVEPPQSQPFVIEVETQRGVDPLPVTLALSPLRVEAASGEVGLVGLAFGPDAQPENVTATGMSAVNLGDFDASLLPGEGIVLHRVFRYGAEEGSGLEVKVSPVDPEVRVTSRQVISLGDERLVVSIQFTAEITRAGLFQLSFPLPEGLEVESLTGGALHHWSELTEGDQRQIVMHLNGKTIGAQEFSLTLAGLAPSEEGQWEVPRFELNEAERQTGDLVIRPATGIRLRTDDRQNLSEIDPREMGGDARGALAFRLLQRDWTLTLGVEKLEPWITGQVLQVVTLREGQTRTALTGSFKVENAAIRILPVRLPIMDEDEIRTLRASGDAVSDLVRTAPDSDLWEIHFQRRIVGNVEFGLEFERRDDREDGNESVLPATFPTARQVAYHVGVRTSGRLEIDAGDLPAGWQRSEWNAVAASLRDASSDRTTPALTLRVVSPGEALKLEVRRHSLAEALKLRVASGNLTTVLSPTGGELTAVDLTMEVVQRSSLTVGLPPGGELFNIFVNGESVHSVRQGDAWQFYILPGTDERTAQVRFVYAVPRAESDDVSLVSPVLDVPLENLSWQVVAPPGMELEDSDGDLEFRSGEARGVFDRNRYFTKAQENRADQVRKATQLLEQANQLIQSGDQAKARQALNTVANGFAIDAASNEDARVQLENLQTQQAIVGLNTRRQRLVMDNSGDQVDFEANDQVKQGAAANPVLQQGALNFRPQDLVQLLQGNTDEDNAVLQRIAGRIVRQQRTIEPATRAMSVTLPEEGQVYRFERALQVAENAPLKLELEFGDRSRPDAWKVLLVLAMILGLAAMLGWQGRRMDAEPG